MTLLLFFLALEDLDPWNGALLIHCLGFTLDHHTQDLLPSSGEQAIPVCIYDWDKPASYNVCFYMIALTFLGGKLTGVFLQGVLSVARTKG